MADKMLLCGEEAIRDCPDYSGIRFGYELNVNEVGFICGAGKEGTAFYLHTAIKDLYGKTKNPLNQLPVVGIEPALLAIVAKRSPRICVNNQRHLK